MPRAPLFTEAEGVWGIRAVRDSGRQDDWGGHRSCWDMGSGRRAAPSRDVHLRHRDVFVVFQAGFSAFVIFHYSPLPTRLLFLSCWFMQSEGAPADGADVNHPSVYGWRPTPWGVAQEINWNWPNLSSPFISFVILFHASLELKFLMCTVASLYWANGKSDFCIFLLELSFNCVIYMSNCKPALDSFSGSKSKKKKKVWESHRINSCHCFHFAIFCEKSAGDWNSARMCMSCTTLLNQEGKENLNQFECTETQSL